MSEDSEQRLRMQCLDLATRVGAFLMEMTPSGEMHEDCVVRAKRYYDFVMGTGVEEALKKLALPKCPECGTEGAYNVSTRRWECEKCDGGKTLAEWAGVRGGEGR